MFERLGKGRIHFLSLLILLNFASLLINLISTLTKAKKWILIQSISKALFC